MYKRLFFLAGCLLVMASLAGAKPQTVYTKDGKKYTGEVKKTADKYFIRTEFMGTVEVSASNVLRIEDIRTEEDFYTAERAKIKPGDPQGHFDLAMALWNKGGKRGNKAFLELAKVELAEALRIKPDFDKASLQLRIVEAKLKTIVEPTTAEAALDRKLLLPLSDIPNIRFEELRADDRVVVKLRNDAIEQFIKTMHGKLEFKQAGFDDVFRGWPRVRQVVYIRENGDRFENPFRADILVDSDPKFMVEFRRLIWPLVQNYCASHRCHGAAKGQGKLKLFAHSNIEQVDYTNFAILRGLKHKGNRIIYRDHPDLSLLLQYGLPRELAETPHGREIEILFKDRRDPNYRRVLAWIRSLDGPGQPRYGLEYKPPFGMKLDFGEGTSDEPETRPAKR